MHWMRLPLSRLTWARAGMMSYPRRPTRQTTRGKSGGIKLEYDTEIFLCEGEGERRSVLDIWTDRFTWLHFVRLFRTGPSCHSSTVPLALHCIINFIVQDCSLPCTCTRTADLWNRDVGPSPVPAFSCPLARRRACSPVVGDVP